MITPEQYFAGKTHTDEHSKNAIKLLNLVTLLISRLRFNLPTCPNTGTPISGSKGGAGDGGFRLPTATTGSRLSSHKEGKGVDLYDPTNELDDMLTDELLERFGLYREYPDDTPHWCHLTTRPPRSGNRTFKP